MINSDAVHPTPGHAWYIKLGLGNPRPPTPAECAMVNNKQHLKAWPFKINTSVFCHARGDSAQSPRGEDRGGASAREKNGSPPLLQSWRCVLRANTKEKRKTPGVASLLFQYTLSLHLLPKSSGIRSDIFQ